MDDVRLAVIPRPDAAVSGGFGALLVVVQPDEPRLSEPGEITLAGDRELHLAEDGPSAFRRAAQIEAEEGRIFVHPFEGPRTVLGTGTLGLEFFEQADALDAVVVAVGGGGLIAGIAAAIKQLSPKTRIYGVEPTGADSMTRSLAAGQPLSLPSVTTIADSLAPPMATPYTFGVCQRFVDSMVLIDDDAMRRAMGVLFRDLKLAVEPAGAAALAAVLGPLRTQLQGGQRIGIVVCGANIDLGTFCRHAAHIAREPKGAES
jgi:threonine dehydratase